nr:alpha/beta fold hydrolase [Candidatus Laterigemmans baculatus]
MEIDSRRYHYVDEGQGDAPLVAVHGNPTWSFYWRRLVAGLSPSRRVLAVDHMGCGLSDKPQRYPYTLAQHRDNLLTWIERLGLERITLVVHDWGGAIGLAAAVERPERFARLIVTNTAAFPPPYVPWRIAACRTPLVGTAALRGLNLFARAATTMATDRYRRLPASAARGLLAPYNNWSHRVAINRFVRDIPLTRRHPTYETLRALEERLPTLADKPIQLIWGMQDWCFRPECLRRFQQVWPAAETVELVDVGHYVMEDAPTEAVAAISDFLSRTDARVGGSPARPTPPEPSASGPSVSDV